MAFLSQIVEFSEPCCRGTFNLTFEYNNNKNWFWWSFKRKIGCNLVNLTQHAPFSCQIKRVAINQFG